jgi:hypothetical protein
MAAKNRVCTGHSSEIIHHLLSRCQQNARQQNYERDTETREILNRLLGELDRKAEFVEDERFDDSNDDDDDDDDDDNDIDRVPFFSVSKRSYKRSKSLH